MHIPQLVEDLRKLPHVDEVLKSSGGLCVRHGDQQALLKVEWKSPAHPREIRETIFRLKGTPGISIVAAPSLSPQSRELLKAENVGYWDSGGSLSLELPWGFYFIDKPPPVQPRAPREPKNLYQGRTAQVLHTLLLQPEREWKVTELAEVAGVSTYTAHQILNHLEERIWVDKRGRGPQTVRRLLHPGKLLDAWAEQHTIADYQVHRFHRLARNLPMQESALFGLLEQGSVCEEWVLTLEHGVQRVAPYVHQLPATMVAIVPQGNWYEVARAAGFREVDEGENFLFLVTKDRTPFLGRKKVDNAWIASPIQLYLDLFAWPRRGREQARHLRSQVLGF